MLDKVPPPPPAASGAQCPGAPVITFNASPKAITAGQSAKLEWRVTNADKAEIDQGIRGILLPAGSQEVKPPQDTIYTLKATGCGGTESKQATVKVQPAPPTCANPPTIGSFNAAPPTIDAGKTSTLSWTTANTTKVEIDQGIGVVTTSQQVVNPKTTTTYILTATGCGKAATKQVIVEVKSAPPPAQAGQQGPYDLSGSNTDVSVKMRWLYDPRLQQFISEMNAWEAWLFTQPQICYGDVVTGNLICLPVPNPDAKKCLATKIDFSDGRSQTADVYCDKLKPLNDLGAVLGGFMKAEGQIRDQQMKGHVHTYLTHIENFAADYLIYDGNNQGVSDKRQRGLAAITTFFNRTLIPYVQQHP